MKTILIAIKNDFARDTYFEAFSKEYFNVIKTGSGREALDLIKTEMPDVALIDAELADIDGFAVLSEIRADEVTKKIPVIAFVQFAKEEDRAKAIEFEANDFISQAEVTPLEVVRRAKIILGEQKSYRVALRKNLYNAKELIADLGYPYEFKCPKCGSDLVLCMIRDLSKGKNYFIVSVVCPECD